MNTDDLRSHLTQIGCVPETIEFVLACAANAPVRKMKGHGGSVRHEVYSQKMGRTHMFESRTVELPFGMFLERDPDVLAYIPQPCEMPLKIGDGVGSTRIIHTPDALVVWRTKVTCEEWKGEEAYKLLAVDKPRRYKLIGGVVHDPAAEEYAASKGIEYRIRSRAELPEVLIENLEYLDDFRCTTAQALSDHDKDRIRAVFAINPFLTLKEALEVEPHLSVDDWMKAIVDGHATVDLSNDRLAVQAHAFVYRDELTMEFAKAEKRGAMLRLAGTQTLRYVDGMSFDLDGRWFQLTTAGDSTAFLTDENGQAMELPLDMLEKAFRAGKLKIESVPEVDGDTSEAARRLREADVDDLMRAKQKLGAVREPLSHTDVPARTRRHWARIVKEAEESGRDPLNSLLDGRAAQGNRTVRYEAEHLDVVRRIVKKEYFQLHRASKTAAYERYRLKLERLRRRYKKYTWQPISRQSFGQEIERIRDTGANFARLGKRMGAAMRPSYVASAYRTSVHGVRPFHVVHIDHTLADVELMSEYDGKSLGRAWLSVASDADRRYILAWSLSFRAPDAATTLGLLRDVVKRHGRLPAILVLDNGADFRSASLDHFCAAYSVHKRLRPPGEARFGSVCERLFGTINTEFLHRLRGNTDLMKFVRTVTGSSLPEKISRWSLRALKIGLGFFIDNVYHKDQHPALLTSPAEAFESGMREHGRRHSRLVADDETLQVLTSPFVHRKSRKLCRRTGVKVDEMFYHSTALQEPGLDGQTVFVRRHPSDVDVVWVQVKRQWVKAWRTGSTEARGLNAWEADLYATELLARKRISKAEARSFDTLRRKTEMCNLIEELERAENGLFRRLREEGLISLGTSSRAGIETSGASPRAEQPMAAAPEAPTKDQRVAAPRVTVNAEADFEDYDAPL